MKELEVKTQVMGRGRRRSRLRHVAGLLFMVGAVAACGGSDTSPALDGSVDGAKPSEAGADGSVAGDSSMAGDGSTEGRDGSTSEAGPPVGDGGLSGPLDFPRLPKRHLAIGVDICVIAMDHTVECTGQSGLKASENHDFVSIVTGGADMCGLRSDHTLYCWFGLYNAPEFIPPGKEFVEYPGVGSTTACGLLRDGSVSCANRQTHQTFTYPGTFTQLAPIAEEEVCGLTPQGSALCVKKDGTTSQPPFGDSNFVLQAVRGNLCASSAADGLRCLQRSQATGQWMPYGTPVPAVRIFSGGQSLCTVSADGRATCRAFYDIQQFEPPQDVRFVDITVDSETACGISDVGEVWCWGDLSPAGRGQPAHKVDFPKPALTD